MKKENLKNYKSKLDLLENKISSVKEKENIFKESIKEDLNQINNAKVELNLLKEIVEKEARKEYATTNEKKLLGGIGIRETTNYLYTKESAIKWAKEHNLCLQLDEKAFKQIIKVQKLDFVKSENKIQVTFPKVIKLED